MAGVKKHYVTSYKKDYCEPKLDQLRAMQALARKHYLTENGASKPPEGRPCHCAESMRSAKGDNPGSGGWSRNELMGFSLDPKLYSVPPLATKTTSTPSYQRTKPMSTKTICETESSHSEEHGRFRSTYTSSYCKSEYGSMFDIKDNLGEFKCGFGPKRSPSDPCEDPKPRPPLVLPCKKILELPGPSRCEKGLVHPLGIEYEENPGVIDLGKLIMQDRPHRYNIA